MNDSSSQMTEQQLSTDISSNPDEINEGVQCDNKPIECTNVFGGEDNDQEDNTKDSSSQMTEQQLSTDISSQKDEINSTNVFGGEGYDNVLPFQPVPLSTETEEAHADNIVLPETNSYTAPIRLDNPKGEQLGYAMFYLISDLPPDRECFGCWTKLTKPDFPEDSKLFRNIVLIHADAYHTLKVPLKWNDLTALTSIDFNDIVRVIRTLRGKVGIAEIAIMVLMARMVDSYSWYGWNQIKSVSTFLKVYSRDMGVSPSKAREYYNRGKVFLKHKDDILNGVGGVPGIPLETVASSCLAKLTYYDKAVELLGREQALSNLKNCTFKEFQEKMVNASGKDDGDKPKKSPSDNKSQADDLTALYEANSAYVHELNLRPNEKRLLRIIAKGGRPIVTRRLLTDEEIEVIESRLREYRVNILQQNYDTHCSSRNEEHFDVKNPLAISDNLFEIKDYEEIILRIRTGIALLQPARRLIAILLFRLYFEGHFKNKWKNPRDGVKYSSFKDFAIEELGMGEDYRVYLAVGKVLKTHYYFLEYLTDLDTEAMFLKLRYLPDALRTHKNNKPLVLARLRSLTVREFKTFSVFPDFEATFSKRLTKKQLERFTQRLSAIRPLVYPSGQRNMQEYFIDSDFVESYYKLEDRLVDGIICKYLDEVDCASSSSTQTSNEPVASAQINEVSDLDTPETSDNSEQKESITAA
ncbi:MAG: hypothetical protein LBI03_10070 [Clostridiales bacterium]|jgi:hypothetical protein|nr:hypothetical protein [Clostridiales bacterium]